VLTPVRAPNANAHAERFVRSIKEECIESMIPMGERHVRRAVTGYVAHHHGDRNQGLQNRVVTAAAIGPVDRVRRRSRLGGLFNN
jgi:hypothetical protein